MLVLGNLTFDCIYFLAIKTIDPKKKRKKVVKPLIKVKEERLLTKTISFC